MDKLQIEDKGGGISRGDMDKIWFYSYTSSNINNINGKYKLNYYNKLM